MWHRHSIFALVLGAFPVLLVVRVDLNVHLGIFPFLRVVVGYSDWCIGD